MAKTSSRQVQHRPERDVARGKELTAARKEIKQLKRLVSRLQKTVTKLEDQRGISVQLEEASPEPAMATAPTVDTEALIESKCRACGSSEQTRFTTPGGKVLISCRNCKTRR